MSEDAVRLWVGKSALGVETVAVIVIVASIAVGSARFVSQLIRRVDGEYERFKRQIGKSLLLGLELLVAADIINSVIVEQNLSYLLTLGMLVIIRTFLSWSMLVEMEGRWPWQGRAVPETHPDD